MPVVAVAELDDDIEDAEDELELDGSMEDVEEVVEPVLDFVVEEDKT